MQLRRLQNFLKRSYDQNKRCHKVKSLIYGVLKTSDLRRVKDARFNWRRPIYEVFQTFDLRRLEDVRFTTLWRRLIYVFNKFVFWRFEGVY